MDINQIIEQEANKLYPMVDIMPRETGYHENDVAEKQQEAYKAGRLKSIERIKELEEGLRGIIEFCQGEIFNSMKEYGKAKDKAIENMCATESMTYGIISDKAKQLLKTENKL